MKIKQMIIPLLMVLAGCGAVSSAFADDIDVFQGLSAASVDTDPKILLLVDTSGSMRCAVGESFGTSCKDQSHATQKMTKVQNALKSLIHSLDDDISLGLSRFTGPGGSIIYPIRRLGDFAGKDENNVNEEFTVTLPVVSAMDEATLRNGSYYHDSVDRADDFDHVSIPNEENLKSVELGVRDTSVLLRFPDAYIPAGAEVTKAELILYGFGDSVTNSTMKVGVLNKADMPEVEEALFSSEVLQESEISISNWPKGDFESIDITSLFQGANAIQNKVDWCAGNAIGMRMQSSATAPLTTKSFMVLMAGDPSAGPRIRLTFKEGDLSEKNCIRRQFTQDLEEDNSKIESPKDLVAKPEGDGYAITNDGTSLTIGNGYKSLVEFQGVNIPFPATDTFNLSDHVEDVFIELTPKNDIAGPTNITINLVKDSVGAIDGDFFKSSDGLTSASIPWVINGAKVNEVYQSENLKSLLSEVNWQPGDGIRIYLTSPDTTEKNFYSFEGNYVFQPRIVINWKASFENRVALSSRFKLLNLVESLPEGGGTPVAGALFEASQYLLGEQVYGGSSRGWNFGKVGVVEPRMSSTVSSPLTLTKDVNNEPETGAGTNLCGEGMYERSSQCTSEILNGQYQSPLSFSDTCENAHIVLIGDGQPTTSNSQSEGTHKLVHDANSDTLATKVANMVTGVDMPLVYDETDPEGDKIDSCLDTYGNEGSLVSASMNCSYIISNYLLNEWDIKTHVIGFDFGEGNEMFQKIATKYGGGLYATTNSSSGLRAAIKNTIHSTYRAPGSIISPGIAVNQFSRFKHLDRLFFSVFEPTDTRYWLGNIKQYALNEKSEIVGMNSSGGKSSQSAVVRDDEGKASVFSKDARSFWSEEVDGNNIKIGGVASLLKPDSWSDNWGWDIVDDRRNVLSFLGAYSNSDGVYSPDDVLSDENIADNNNELSSAYSSWGTVKSNQFDLLTNLTDDVEKQDFLNWLAGYIPGSDPLEPRMQMGAPLHSQATLVNYGYDDKDDPDSASDFEKQWNTLFVSTNEGALHAIDALSGREFFAFYPQELLQHAVQLYKDIKLPSQNHIAYGLDSTWTPWRLDYITKVSDEGPWQRDGFIDEDDKDHVYLYGGMRRGGRNYFALDVSNVHRGNGSDLSPKLLWVIKGGEGDFEKLGQTWSEPNLVALESTSNSSSSIRRAIVFGGGYDPAYDDHRGTLEDIHNVIGGVAMGNAFYIVDAESKERAGGKVLFSTSDDFDYPIPGNIKGIDINGNGLTDRFYFADLGGQIWRLDWNNSVYSESNKILNTLSGGRANLTRVAKLGDANSNDAVDDRRFYESLSVAKIMDASGDAKIAILAVSGHRANPSDNTVQNRAYIIFDDVGSGGVTDVTETNLARLNLSGGEERVTLGAEEKGWYFDLNKEDGEKAWGAPVIINNNIMFSTFVPTGGSTVSVANDSCGATADFGYSIIYGMSVFDGSSTGILNNIASLSESELGARSVKVSPTGGVNLLIGDDGDITIISGTESFKANGLSLKPRKVRWRRHENTIE